MMLISVFSVTQNIFYLYILTILFYFIVTFYEILFFKHFFFFLLKYIDILTCPVIIQNTVNFVYFIYFFI